MLHFEVYNKFRTASGEEFVIERECSVGVADELAKAINPTAEYIGICVSYESATERRIRRAQGKSILESAHIF